MARISSSLQFMTSAAGYVLLLSGILVHPATAAGRLHSRQLLQPAARRVLSPCVGIGMVVEQRDLHFNHPATAVTVSFRCPGCAATNVRLRCESAAWPAAAPQQLQVAGNGLCLLRAGHVIPPMSSMSFVYLHSPPLDLQPISFDCA